MSSSNSNSSLRARLWREHRDKAQKNRVLSTSPNTVVQLDAFIKAKEKEAKLLVNETLGQCEKILESLNDVFAKQERQRAAKNAERKRQRAAKNAAKNAERERQRAERKRQRAVKNAERERQRAVNNAQREKQRAANNAQRERQNPNRRC